MSTISDRELWACAAHVLKTQGANAPRHVAERIGALALAGALTEIEAPATRQ
jgi:hypothetical protein